MKCARHGTDAIGVCVECGRAVCEQCAVQKDKLYCLGCAEALVTSGNVPKTPRGSGIGEERPTPPAGLPLPEAAGLDREFPAPGARAGRPEAAGVAASRPRTPEEREDRRARDPRGRPGLGDESKWKTWLGVGIGAAGIVLLLSVVLYNRMRDAMPVRVDRGMTRARPRAAPGADVVSGAPGALRGDPTSKWFDEGKRRGREWVRTFRERFPGAAAASKAKDVARLMTSNYIRADGFDEDGFTRGFMSGVKESIRRTSVPTPPPGPVRPAANAGIRARSPVPAAAPVPSPGKPPADSDTRHGRSLFGPGGAFVARSERAERASRPVGGDARKIAIQNSGAYSSNKAHLDGDRGQRKERHVVTTTLRISNEALSALRSSQQYTATFKIRDNCSASAWRSKPNSDPYVIVNSGPPHVFYRGGSANGDKEVTVSLPSSELVQGKNSFKFATKCHSTNCLLYLYLDDDGPPDHTTAYSYDSYGGDHSVKVSGDLVLKIESQ